MDVWNISCSSGFYMLRNHNGSIDMHIKLEFRHICLIDKLKGCSHKLYL